jgi:hypothetical protein
VFSLEYENTERSDRKMIDLCGREGSPRRMLNDQWAFMQVEVRAAELRQHFEQHRMSALFAELAGLLRTGGRVRDTPWLARRLLRDARHPKYRRPPSTMSDKDMRTPVVVVITACQFYFD